jgi:hypothetical protein
VKTLGLHGIPSDVAVGAGSVWVLHSSSLERTTPGTADAIVSRIDPSSYLIDAYETGSAFDDVNYENPIAVAGGVWVAVAATGPGARGVVARLDPRRPNIHSTVALPRAAIDLAGSAEGAWAAGEAGLAELRPSVAPLLPVEGTAAVGTEGAGFPSAVAIGAGYVWGAGEISRRCPGPNPCAPRSGVIWRVDPGTGFVTTKRFDGAVGALAAGAGAVWLGRPEEKSVWKLDPESLDVLATVDLGRPPGEIVVLGGRVFVATF